MTEPASEPVLVHSGADLLGLPEAARQDHRVTKKMLAEQFTDRAPADARLISKAIASARLVGILRPETIQVPRYADTARTVTDIPVLDVTLAEKATAAYRSRVAELIHRSMDKPVVALLTAPNGTALLSLALSHPSRTDPNRSTSAIDAHLTIPVAEIAPATLHVGRLDHTDMWALYRDLVRVAAAGGRPASSALTAAQAVETRRRLGDLEAELDSVVRDAKHAHSQQARIDLNVKARDLRTRISEAREALYRR